MLRAYLCHSSLAGQEAVLSALCIGSPVWEPLKWGGGRWRKGGRAFSWPALPTPPGGSLHHCQVRSPRRPGQLHSQRPVSLEVLPANVSSPEINKAGDISVATGAQSQDDGSQNPPNLGSCFGAIISVSSTPLHTNLKRREDSYSRLSQTQEKTKTEKLREVPEVCSHHVAAN